MLPIPDKDYGLPRLRCRGIFYDLPVLMRASRKNQIYLPSE